MSGTVWNYRVQMLSKRGSHVFGYTHVLTDIEYAIPELRAAAERKAEAELRNIEGVTPDMPIEHLGWMKIEWGDES